MQLFQVDVPIFNKHVVVATRCTEQEAIDAMYDHQGNRVVLKNTVPSLGWVQEAGGDIYMWVANPDKNASVVFHELLHVACSICSLSGISSFDEELTAYLMGWLKINVCDEIYKGHYEEGENTEEGSE